MSHVTDLMCRPQAIRSEKRAEVRAFYRAYLGGQRYSAADFRAMFGEPDGDRKPYSIVNGHAIINIHGILSKRMNLISRCSGGTSTEKALAEFEQAMADPGVTQAVLDIDSPGGDVDGTQILARGIAAARGTKPIIAVVNGQMCSAAMWIGSAADKIYVLGDTAEIGSIGVILETHESWKWEEDEGFKRNLIYAGHYKSTGHPGKPMEEDERAYLQALVNGLYKTFVDDVASNRGISTESVLKAADGRVYLSGEAIKLGLADQVIYSMDALLMGEIKEEVAMDDEREDHEEEEATSAMDESEEEEEDEDEPSAMDETEEEEEEEEEASASASAKSLLNRYPKAAKELVRLGASRERARIRAIEKRALPGHEKLIQRCKWDGKTTGQRAADLIVLAERKLGSQRLARIQDEAPAPVKPRGLATTTKPKGEFDAKAEWDSDPKLRAEFAERFEAYEAYLKGSASGQIVKKEARHGTH